MALTTYKHKQDNRDAADIGEIDGGAGDVHDLGHNALKEFGGGVAQHLGADDHENSAGDGKDEYKNQGNAVRLEIFQEGPHRFAETFWFFPAAHGSPSDRRAMGPPLPGPKAGLLVSSWCVI